MEKEMSQIDKLGGNSVEIDFGGSIGDWKEEENITQSLEIFSAHTKNHAIDDSTWLSMLMSSKMSETDVDAACREADEMLNDRENANTEKVPKDILEIGDIEIEDLDTNWDNQDDDGKDEATSLVTTEAATANSLEMSEEFEGAIDDLLDDVMTDNQDVNLSTTETIDEVAEEIEDGEELQIDREDVKGDEADDHNYHSSFEKSEKSSNIANIHETPTIQVSSILQIQPSRKRRFSQIDDNPSSSGMSSGDDEDENYANQTNNEYDTSDETNSDDLIESDDDNDADEEEESQVDPTSARTIATQTSIFDTITIPPNPYYHEGPNVFTRNSEKFTSVTNPPNMQDLLEKLWKWDNMPTCSSKFMCPECGHFLISYYDNRDHFLVHHLGKRLICGFPMCGKMFLSGKPTVRYHMMRHNWATIEEMRRHTEGRDFVHFDASASLRRN